MLVDCRLLGDHVWRLVMAPEQGEGVRLSVAGLERLLGLLHEAEQSDGCRVLVLEGQAGSFCQGMDVEALDGAQDEATVGTRLYADALAALRGHAKLTLAAVDGGAFGGGVGLAAASDVMIATRGSVFGLPEVTLGLIPAMVMPLLVERMSPQKVRRLALTAASVDATHAQQLGLVDELVDDAAGLERSVRRLARNALRADPRALRAVKRFCSELTAEAWQRGLADGCGRTTAALSDRATRQQVAHVAAGNPAPWYARLRTPAGGSLD